MKKSFLLIIAMLICAICLSSCCCCTSMFQNEEEQEGENKYVNTNGLDVDAYYVSDEGAYLPLGSKPLFSEDILWEPNYIAMASVKIESNEAIVCKYRIKLIADDAETNGYADIRDVIEVYMLDNNMAVSGSSLNYTSQFYIGTLAELEGGTLDYIYPGEMVGINIILKMRADASNDYQNLSLGDVYAWVEVFELTAESDNY